MKPRFVFCACQPGAESALKAEVARLRPKWKASFQRPGFVTFRRDENETDADPLWPSTLDQPRPIFARVSGISLGKGKSAADILKIARAHFTSPVRLHVWAQEECSEERASHCDEVFSELRNAPLWKEDEGAQVGDTVFDVWVDEPGMDIWCGTHVHEAGMAPMAGGSWGLTLPAESPSRAWLKIEEALLWSRTEIKAGDRVVEVGSAPGGASFALLSRGVELYGVDPGQMDERVLRHPKFRHLAVPVASLRRENLPATIQWVLLDMNVSPLVTLHQMSRLVPLLGESLLGAFLTLKLNEEGLESKIPELLAKVQDLGLKRVRGVQLFSHRREFLAFGLTRKGLIRQRSDG